MRVATIIGSTRFEDLERGVAFSDEELLLQPSELPTMPVEDFAEADMIEDAIAEEEE